LKITGVSGGSIASPYHLHDAIGKLIAIYLGRWLRPIMVKRFLTSGELRNVNFYFT